MAASDSRKGAKVDETRLTLGLCYNCYGTEIVPMLIGRSAQPRIFKNYDFSVFELHYFHNKNAWCTKDVFIDWLNIVNDAMVRDNRRILIICDNFSPYKSSI